MKRVDREWLLGPILSVLGCGALMGIHGCGGEVTSPHGDVPAGGASDDSPAAAGNSGAGRSANGPGEGGSSGAAGSGSGGAGGEPPVSIWEYTSGDLPIADPPTPVACRGIQGAILEGDEAEFRLEQGSARAFCGESLPDIETAYGLCLPGPAVGQTCAEAYPFVDVASRWNCGYSDIANYVCGAGRPPPGSQGCAGDECCYVINGGCPVGRPFTVGGRARHADLVRHADWLRAASRPAVPDVAPLDRDTRRALADVYSKDGLTEHASIASFARFVLECLAVGAPADILADAQRALADEVRHATTSFALASAYAGVDLGPSALDVSDAMPQRVTLADCALRTFCEACVAETVSAALIHAAAGAASDAAVKHLLSGIAEDERRHAALAWRFVSWAVALEGEPLRARLRDEMQRAQQHIGLGALAELRGDAALMRAHGYLSEAERRQIAMQVLGDVVLPCAALVIGKDGDGESRRGHANWDAGRLVAAPPAATQTS